MDKSGTSYFVISILRIEPTALMDSGKSDMANGLDETHERSNYQNSLQLGCFGYGGSESNGFRSSNRCTTVGNYDSYSNTHDDECTLVLGLGPSPSSYPKRSYLHNKKGLSFEGDSILQLCLSKSCSDNDSNIVPYASGLAESDVHTSHHRDHISYCGNEIFEPIVDEGSTSAKKSNGYLTTIFTESRVENSHIIQKTKEMLEIDAISHSYPCQLSSEPSVLSDYSRSTVSVSATTMTTADRRINNNKRCKSDRCNKGARGATGFCIGHGGGQRCQKSGCDKGAENRTPYCKAHGGGKRCHELGCTKSAEGKTDFCIAHGGGRRCSYPDGCSKAARGKSGFCIRHGGGKRCKVNGCTRSAEGQIGLCISHGGGRRCQFTGCVKGSQGSTMFCKAHGGGKRCTFVGCTKGAEGSTALCKGHGGGKRCCFEGGGICPKSVHGGTNFCVAHGGGKRCVVLGCMKSARGRTDRCVKHGGGRRCKIYKCGKSAQGSTEFCKAHGGGRRCNWGGGKCEKFARGKSGLCAAHTSLVSEGDQTNKTSMIGPILFHGLVSSSPTVNDNLRNSYSSSKIGLISECISFIEKPCIENHPIQPQGSVPVLMEGSSSFWRSNNNDEEEKGSVTGHHLVIPEGRVHGGGLMSLFGRNLKNALKEL